MDLEIKTSDRELLALLFAKIKGAPIKCPEGMSVVYQNLLLQRDATDVVTVLLTVHLAFANLKHISWLWDKIISRAQKVRANGEEIELSPEAVKRIFEKHQNLGQIGDKI